MPLVPAAGSVRRAGRTTSADRAVGDEVLGAVERPSSSPSRRGGGLLRGRRPSPTRARTARSSRASRPPPGPAASASSARRCRDVSSGAHTSELFTDMITPVDGAGARDLLQRQRIADGVHAGAAPLLAAPPRPSAPARPAWRSPRRDSGARDRCARRVGAPRARRSRGAVSRISFCSGVSSRSMSQLYLATSVGVASLATKACMPCRRSAVANSAANISALLMAGIASGRLRRAGRIASLQASAMASGARAAMAAAARRPRPSALGAGRPGSPGPCAAASAASMMSPVNSSSRARAGPTRRGQALRCRRSRG